MSSQKYAKLAPVTKEDGTTAQVWHCKIDKDECVFTSFHNAKPMCDRCPVSKKYKGDVKRGKSLINDILKKERG